MATSGPSVKMLKSTTLSCIVVLFKSTPCLRIIRVLEIEHKDKIMVVRILNMHEL